MLTGLRPAWSRIFALALLLAGGHGSASAGVTQRARFDAVLDAGGDWLMSSTNDSGNLAWGESYVMAALVMMYRTTGDATYLDQAARHVDGVLAQRDSVRGVVDYRGKSLPCWQATDPRYVARPYCFAVHTGMIAAPIVELAATIRADPALLERTTYDGETLGAKADAYVAAGQAAADVHDDEWRTSGNRGYYVFRPDMAEFYPAAGQPVPLNMMNAMGLLHLELLAATGEPNEAAFARALANYFRAQLTVATDGGYAWNYRAGAYLAPGEDVSHAALNVEFVARAAEAGVVFGDADLARMSRTFWRAWIDNARSFDFIGGSGSQNGSRFRLQLGRWAVLAGDDPSIHAAARDLFEAQGATSSGSLLLVMALLSSTDLPIRGYDFYVADWRDDGDERVTTAAAANLLVVPDDPANAQLFRVRYRSAVPFKVSQWDGVEYHVVAELAATGGAVGSAHVAYHPEHYFDYGGQGALFQLDGPAGIAVLEPEPSDPPRFTAAPPSSARVGATYAYTPEVAGPGPFRFSLAQVDDVDVSFDDSTGELSFTAGEAGAVAFSLTVESDHGSATQEWTVEVSATGDDGDEEDDVAGSGGCAAGGSGHLLAGLVLLGLLLARRRSDR